MGRYLTTGAAARVKGCHPKTVLEACHSGELEALAVEDAEGFLVLFAVSTAALRSWKPRPQGRPVRRSHARG